MSRLLDPKDKSGRFPFDYKPAAATDIRETFRKAREKIESQKTKVCQLKRKP